MTPPSRGEAHHAAPRCLLRLHEKANGNTTLDGEGIEAWLEWEWEAMRWRVPVEISRTELEDLVEHSAEVLERERHRLLHEGDWRRWGSRGGRETVRRYGHSWMSLLALKRWGRITAEELDASEALSMRPRYWELGCSNPECCSDEVWEVYARAEDYRDGSFDLVPISDGPGLNGGSTRCPDCDEEGELP